MLDVIIQVEVHQDVQEDLLQHLKKNLFFLIILGKILVVFFY